MINHIKKMVKSAVAPVQRLLDGTIACQEAEVVCRKEHFGTASCGWTVCPSFLNKNSIVYSFGVGEDMSFDLALIERFGMVIHAFDPTPKSIAWVQSQKVPDAFALYEYGLASYDGTAFFSPPEKEHHVSHTMPARPSTADRAVEVPVFQLGTIAQELGHQHIDILKMDIEGAEYKVIPNVLASGIGIDQILIEFHHRFKNVRARDTNRAIETLHAAGYVVFAVSPTKEEYSFIRKDLVSQCA